MHMIYTMLVACNKPHHQVSWRHPRSKHWHQLDLIITKRKGLRNVNNTRTYHSADCDTDHSLVASGIKLRSRKLHRTKQSSNPRINVSKTAFPEKNEELLKLLSEEYHKSSPDLQNMNATEGWNFFRETIYNTAVKVYGKRERQNRLVRSKYHSNGTSH